MQAVLKALPEKVPLRELIPGEQIVNLEEERKTLTDTIKFAWISNARSLAFELTPCWKVRNFATTVNRCILNRCLINRLQ